MFSSGEKTLGPGRDSGAEFAVNLEVSVSLKLCIHGVESGSRVDLGLGGDLFPGLGPEVLGFGAAPGIVVFVADAAGVWACALGLAANWGA